MKKILFVIVLCIAVLFANAQDKKEVKKEKKKIEKTQTPAKVKVEVKDLLAPITEDINKNYTGAKIEKAVKNETKGVVTYEVHILKDNVKTTLVYDNAGKFLKKEAAPKRIDAAKVEQKKELKPTEQPKK